MTFLNGEPDSEPGSASPEDLARLEKVRKRNAGRVQRLAMGGAALDPFSLLNMRLQVLIESLQPTEAERVAYEQRFEEGMEQVLEQMLNEQVRSRLHVPGR